VNDYPAAVVPPEGFQRAPRRIRGVVAGEMVLDTTRAWYVWESSRYPSYFVPLDDLRSDVLIPEGISQHTPFGQVELHALRVGDRRVARAARVLAESSVEGLSGTVHLEWSALDAWYEEDEQVFVHPRNPYARVDALRSTRHVRVELDGLILADSYSPVLLFETGLPTRYYLNRSEVRLEVLIRSDTVSQCPYKGITSGYWSVETGSGLHQDIAWTYDFPAVQVAQIAGLVAFYNEKVDLLLDGRRLDRPTTPFSPRRHAAS
jgi:uncharacterized protein (DUF427 family)